METDYRREIENATAISASPEREREHILDELEHKVEIIKTLVEVINSVDDKEDYEEVQKKLHTFLEGMYQSYPEAAKKLPQSFEDKPIEKLPSREDAKSERQRDDVRFLSLLSRGIESLMEKWKKVQEVKEDKRAMLSELGLEKSKVAKEYITPFCIDIIVKEEYFKQENGREETAHHVTNSPYNVYSDKEDAEQLDLDITHERTHTFLENFLPPLAYPSRLLKDRFAELDRARRNSDIEEVEICKKELLSIKPSFVIDLLHEEMIADVDSVKKVLHYKFFDASHEGRMEVGFSTAQDEIELVTKFLRTQGKREQNEIMRLFCSALEIDVDKKFNQSACLMRKALFLGKYFKEDTAVLSLLILLQPSKFHHIESFLKSRIQKELYEGYAAFYEMVGESKLSLKGLRSLLIIKDGLHEGHRFILKSILTRFHSEGNYLTVNDIRYLKDLHLYNQDVAELGEFLEMEEEVMTYHEAIVSRIFFHHWLQENLKDDFKELPRLVSRLHHKDQWTFSKELENFFSGDAQRYISRQSGEKELLDGEYIKNLPFWMMLVELGLDKIVESGLGRYKERNK